jgi:hypothetical protein
MDFYYPYSSPIILTDSIFENYGGFTGTTTAAQRQAAYVNAEIEVSNLLETYLLPTVVTGTYSYNPTLVLDHTYVNSVQVVQFIDTEEDVYWSQTGTANIYVSLRNDTYGLLDLHYLTTACRCHNSGRLEPYHVRVMYTAGLPSGTATQADFLLALTTYAKIILNEIVGYGNEAPGDIGVQEYKNQQYSERRVYLFKTALGSSPQAHFANRILNKYKRRRAVAL